MAVLRETTKLGITPITEVSVNRILAHGQHGFIVISANRSEIRSNNPNVDLQGEYSKWLDENHFEDADDKENLFLKLRNEKANEDLLHDIRHSKFSYTPVFGGYHGKDSVKDSYEPSYIVYCHGRGGIIDKSSWERLREFAIAMCGKYNQESVYVQAPNEAPVYLDCNGNQTNDSSSLNFKVNRDNEIYYTTNKRKSRTTTDNNGLTNSPHRFTADIRFDEMYMYRGASDYNNHMRRTKLGEVFLND